MPNYETPKLQTTNYETPKLKTPNIKITENILLGLYSRA
jgi:hypothetical protein